MSKNPSTKNYTLGKGKCYFNKLNPVSGLYEGERDLGNAPEVVTNIELEKLAHYSSRGGLKAKDKSVILEITPMLNFVLDEHSADNVALLYMADSTDTVQSALDDLVTVVAGVNQGRYYPLDARKIGIMALSYKTMTGAFAVGEVVSGVTGEGTVLQVITGVGATGTLYLTDITAGFIADEALTGDATGVAVVVATEAFVATNVSVFDTATPSTFYTLTTDYTVDANSGRIGIVYGGGIADGANITVSYGCEAAEFVVLNALAQTVIEGMFRFVSDNPAGTNRELEVWRLSITPTGDTAYIGDDWSTLAFEGEILKDEVGHPNFPYIRITMDKAE